MKKVWEKPKLVVLVRSKPEEAVLNACKGDDVGESSNWKFNGCAQDDFCFSGCVEYVGT